MNKNQSFYRKITYAVLATVLLLPISFIARPASFDSKKNAISNGGVISRLRSEKHLSRASISEIDSTSEIMKLGSLGLHGIAVNLLWNQAQKYEEIHAYDRAKETINTLILLQPNFVNVWEFQAHNLSYNISREFDDYEDRYHWVKEGIDFLIKGIPFNKRNKKVLDNLGLFCGLKLGRSDERKQFRQLFRDDSEYHQKSILGYFDSINEVKHVIAKVDNWLWARGWYNKSYALVKKEVIPVAGELLYYSKGPSQLRSFAESYMLDFPPDQYSQAAWQDAHNSWVNEYGKKTIRSIRGETYTHEGQQGQIKDIEDLRKRLDECAPGARQRLELAKRMKLSDEERAVLQVPIELQRASQLVVAERARRKIIVQDQELLAEVPENLRPTAISILQKLTTKLALVERMARDRQTINYDYWRIYTEMASTDLATKAWDSTYRAKLAQREAFYQDYEVVETVDGLPKTVKKMGSISHRIQAAKHWAEVLKDYPYLANDGSSHVEDMLDEWKRLYAQLVDSGLSWPTDFPLQKIIDQRAIVGFDDGIPTTDQLRVDGAFDKKPSSKDASSKSNEKNPAETKEADGKVEAKQSTKSDAPPKPKLKK